MTTRTIEVGNGLFEAGDIVELVTGSPAMVVLDACPGCGDVDVAYTTPKGKIEILTLPAITLELAS